MQQHQLSAAATSSTAAVGTISRMNWLANKAKAAPLKNPFLFPPSSVVAAGPTAAPRKEETQQRQHELQQQPRAFEDKGTAGSATTYPDHYSPASDRARLCRQLRSSSLALSPRKLIGVLGCLEGVDRLQGQLVRARRELSNLAIFGDKYGRQPQRGAASTPSGAALARSPAARRAKKNNQRRAASATPGKRASRRTVKRKQQRQRARECALQQRAEVPAVRPDDKTASPEVEIKVEEESDGEVRDDTIRAPLRGIAQPNRAAVRRLNWHK